GLTAGDESALKPEAGSPKPLFSVVPDLRTVADPVGDVADLVVGVAKLFVYVVNYRAKMGLHRVVGHRPLTEVFHAVVDVGDERVLHPRLRSGARVLEDGVTRRVLPWRTDRAEVAARRVVHHAFLAVLLVVPEVDELLGRLPPRRRHVRRLL